MRTKLEMMVAYLSGRQGETAESIRREIEDPTSEASRWLEALQSRSRGIFGADLLGTQDPIPPPSIRIRPPAAGVARRRLPPLLFGASAAALVLIAVGAVWRAQDDRLRHLEGALAAREARWGDRFTHLEEALTRREVAPRNQPPPTTGPKSEGLKPPAPADGPTSLALARIEARLGELGQRLGEGRPGQEQDDQGVAQLRRDLDRLRQEVGIAGRASKQESRELSVAVREILDLLRRLAMPAGTTEPMRVPVPVPPPGHEPGVGQGPGMLPGTQQVPGQAQMPGLDHSYRAPGRGKR